MTVFFLKVLTFTTQLCSSLADTAVCSDPASSCGVPEDETSLLQVKTAQAAGTKRLKSPSNQAQDASAHNGHFHYLRGGDDQGETCNVEGTWHHEEFPSVKFHSQPRSLFLGIEGLPTVLLRFGSMQNSSSLELELAGRPVSFESDHFEQAEGLFGEADIFERSSFASLGAKRMSDLLDQRSHDGSKSPCAHRLQLLLLALASASASASSASESTRSAWGPYGFDEQCPSDGDALGYTTWKCQVKDGDFVRPPNPEIRASWLGDGMESIPCTSDNPNGPWQVEECQGMCGAGCSCWGGVCGKNYNCEYNPMCCAHDYACASRRRMGGKVTRKCMDFFTVQKACGMKGIVNFNGDIKKRMEIPASSGKSTEETSREFNTEWNKPGEIIDDEGNVLRKPPKKKERRGRLSGMFGRRS